MTPAQLIKHSSYFGRHDTVEEGHATYDLVRDGVVVRCTAVLTFRHFEHQRFAQVELYEDGPDSAGAYTIGMSTAPTTLPMLAAAARMYEFLTAMKLRPL